MSDLVYDGGTVGGGTGGTVSTGDTGYIDIGSGGSSTDYDYLGGGYSIKTYEYGNDMVLEIESVSTTYSFGKPTIVDVSELHSDITVTDINDSFYGNYDSIENPFTNKYISEYRTVGTVDWEVNNADFTETVYQYDVDFAIGHYEFDNALNSAKDEFNSNKSKSDGINNNENDNWDISFGIEYFNEGTPFDVSITETVKKAQLILNTTESQNMLMAGGISYNSSFAGGNLFNVTGEINSTEFLGIDNKNFNYMFRAKEGLLGEPNNMLNITAGNGIEDYGMSIFTIIHNAKLSSASGENFIVEESSYTGTTGVTKVYRDNRNNSWTDFENDYKAFADSIEDSYKDFADSVEDFFHKLF